MAERFRERFFGGDEHPYRTFEHEVRRALQSGGSLLDVGCGRSAPVLRKYSGIAGRLTGLDLVEFNGLIEGVELRNGSISDTGLDGNSFDVVMARSVMEHVADPVAAFQEVSRVLAPNGTFVFLTANFWDYASIVAKAVPNRLHPWIVERVEGRAPEDVFPVEYRCNTKSRIRRLASDSGLRIERLDYLGQYPAYLLFNGPLFLAGTAYEKLIGRFSSLHWLRGWILAVLKKD